MSDQIFVVHGGDVLVPAIATHYQSEDKLQALLAKYPDLLAGSQMNPAEPRRWLLLRREAGVPDSELAGERWSLDHLFLDQDAIPTLVEVKRSTDTDIRRKVVGQMLDYAANGVVYWPIERLRAWLCDEAGGEAAADARIRDLVGPDADLELFWAAVEQNLRAGRVRMLFVADVIPPELQRIIEFLNDQLNAAEVLGLEVRNYEGDNVRALVPKLIGRTAAAQIVKPQGDPRTFDELFKGASPEFKSLVANLEAWASSRELIVDKTKKALRVINPAKRVLLWAFPNDNGMQLSLESVRNAGGGETADALVEACSLWMGKPAARNYPGLNAGVALSHWDAVVDTLLDPLASV